MLDEINLNPVFHLKLSALLEETNGVLGRVVAHMYVIEFQKRGMPHAHILLIWDSADKTLTPEDIDPILSAQLPDQNLYPELYETITSCMLYGPCGVSSLAIRYLSHELFQPQIL